MTQTTESTCTIWVCTDCMLTENGYDDHIDEDGRTPDGATPWSELEPGQYATYGLMSDEHECDYDEDWHTGRCWCEREDFSRRRCDGCGSNLVGERHAYTLWH